MRPDPYGTTPMDLEIPDAPVAPILTDTSGGHGRATYTRYRPRKPVRCDDCAAAFIGDPHAPASRSAAFRRRQDDTPDLLLCYPHKQMREEREAHARRAASGGTP